VANDYVKGMLGAGEALLIETRQHWIAAIRYAVRPLLIFGLVVLLALLNQWLRFDTFGFINDIINWILIIALIVAVIWLPIDLVQWWSRRYVLTNRRAMRMQGILRKQSFDSSLEQINDIALSQSVLGRQLGYADLTLLTANASSNEAYEQLLDGPQFKKAVLEAKEAIRTGHPLETLPDGFVVKGGTNAASIQASTKSQDQAAAAGTAATATVMTTAAATMGIQEDPAQAGSVPDEAAAIAAGAPVEARPSSDVAATPMAPAETAADEAIVDGEATVDARAEVTGSTLDATADPVAEMVAADDAGPVVEDAIDAVEPVEAAEWEPAAEADGPAVPAGDAGPMVEDAIDSVGPVEDATKSAASTEETEDRPSTDG
jgi:hypothetical protein